MLLAITFFFITSASPALSLEQVIQSGHKQSITRGAISASGTWLLTDESYYTGPLYLWQVSSGRQIRAFRHVNPSKGDGTFSTGFELAFVDGTDENQFIWYGEVLEASTGKSLYTLPVEHVTRDGLTAFGVDGLYDVRSRKLIKKFGKNYLGCLSIEPLVVSTDRKYAAITCEGNRRNAKQKWTMVVALDGDRKVREYFESDDGRHASPLGVADFSRDGKTMFTSDYMVRDIESDAVVYDPYATQKSQGIGGSMDSFHLSPNARWLIVSGESSDARRYIAMHDLATRKLVTTTYHTDAGKGVALTNRFYFATGSPKKPELDETRRSVTVFDLKENLQALYKIGARADEIVRLDFTSNTTFSTSSMGADNTLRNWDLAHGRQIGLEHDVSLATEQNPLYYVATDRRTSPEVTSVRRRDSGKVVFTIPCTKPYRGTYCLTRVWFSSDNRRLAAIAQSREDSVNTEISSKLVVVDIATQKTLYADENPGIIEFFSFSPDGDSIMVSKLRGAYDKKKHDQSNNVIVFDLVEQRERFIGPPRDGMLHRPEMDWRRGTPLQFWSQSEIGVSERDSSTHVYAIDPAHKTFAQWVRLGNEPMGHTGSPFSVKQPHANAALFGGVNLELINGDTGRPSWSISGKGHYLLPSFSPKGDRLVVGALKMLPDGDLRRLQVVWLYDAKTGKQIPLTPAASYSENVLSEFSPDGSRLLLTRRTGAATAELSVLDIYDTQTGKRISTSQALATPAVVAWSPDNRYVATASAREQVRLYDAKSGAFLANFVALKDEDFAVTTADRHYIASRGAANSIHYVDGKKVYTFENFDLIYNRPDLVMQKIGAAPQADIDTALQAYRKRLRRSGIKGEPTANTLALPTITLLDNIGFRVEQFVAGSVAPSLGFQVGDVVTEIDGKHYGKIDDFIAALAPKKHYVAKVQRAGAAVELPFDKTTDKLGIGFAVESAFSSRTNQATVTFRVRAASAVPLDRINVLANDVPVFGSAGLSLANEAPTTIEKEISVPLASGRNRIQVSALSSTGFESLRETIEIAREPSNAKPTLHLIAIGASEYQQRDYNLTYAAKDASDVATLLQSKTTAYNAIKAQTFLNAAVTRDALTKLRENLMQTHVDDVVAIFYAGHGLLDGKLDYFLATNDVDFDHPEVRGIPYDDFEALLDGIPARRKLLIVDACHSGEVDKEENQLVASTDTSDGKVQTRGLKLGKVAPRLGVQGTARLMEDLFSDLRRGSGAIVLSSAAGSERALESDAWHNGVFTYALLEGMKTKRADRDKNGHIDTRELRDYVQAKVKELTSGQQTPTARRASAEFEFFVD